MYPNIQTRQIFSSVLSDIIQNEFAVKDSFTFVDKILTQNSDLHMASLDVDALFTNIPLDETIDICIKKLFETLGTLVKGISKNHLRDLLNLTTKELALTLKKKFYIHVDGVAMGSLLGPIGLCVISPSLEIFNRTYMRLWLYTAFIQIEFGSSMQSYASYRHRRKGCVLFTSLWIQYKKKKHKRK